MAHYSDPPFWHTAVGPMRGGVRRCQIVPGTYKESWAGTHDADRLCSRGEEASK
jgi:hypothetical protein